MNHYRSLLLFLLCLLATTGNSLAQVTTTNWLPGRVVVKLLPDYLRPRVYALNRANGSAPGTLLALNSTNGATLNEISVSLNPTDMVMTPAGDALYVIHAGSRTISKIDLNTFSVAAEKAIATPNSYSTANPLHLAVGVSNRVFFTDGGWAPSITTFDYAAGTNVTAYDDGNGAGGLATTRDGKTLYRWRQYGWGAGNVNSWVTRYSTTNNLTALEDSFTSWRRDPFDTPIFLDAAERWVFNKQQMFAATNVSVLLTSFTDNIYAISIDGSLAFGPTQVYNTQNGILLTNFNFTSTVQILSGDQKKLFRYNAPVSDVVIYDMTSVAPVSGPTIVPTPADGSVVGQPPTNLLWSVSPIALAYDVYFGTNQAQVTAASPTSVQYLGRVSTPGKALPQVLTEGSSYYWRVDVAGFNSTNAGPTWSFTVSPLTVVPTQINIGAIAGFNPASTTLNLTSSVPRTWTAAVTGSNWLVVSPSGGTSPSTLTASFNTTGLPAGLYSNRIDIIIGTTKVQVPVTLDIKPLNIIKMATDYQRPYIYALQAPANTGQNGQLLFINTATGSIEKTLPIGINPTDLTVHYGEGRLYIASWTENATYVVDLNTQTLLPPLHLGTDIYKINAGKPGRVITEGEDQWIGVTIFDTTTGTNIGAMPYPEREGDGETDPTGTFYYHCDNNISNANIHKNQIVNDVATQVAASLQHPYGSRNLVLSADGSRLFWRGYIYDANLNELGYLGEEIYATTSHGDLALGTGHAFNARNGQSVYTWPFATSILAVSGDEQKVFLFNSTTKQLTTVPMSAIASVPGPGLNPTPADGAVVNLPLAQVSWTPSPFALSYRVFFGTNSAAVAAANTNSPLYLGQTFNTSLPLTNALVSGMTYYWRVDSVGFSSATTGAVWAFTTSPINVAPQNLSLKGVVGLPILPQTISLAASGATSWTVQVQQPWLSVTPTSGVTPGTVTLNFNTTNLTVGTYTNQLSFTANGITLNLPVTVQLFNLAASKMVVDRNRNYIYVLHPGSGTFDDAFLLFLNTDTGVVEKVIPIGSNPTDLTVHPREDRLYVSNWQRNQTRVVDLATRTELAPLTLGADVYKINAGLAGRLIYEQQDQWITAFLVDTSSGATVSTAFLREGDGECDPTGRYYYHTDNNSSGAVITKFDVGNNSFVSLASAGPHYYYGSRNLVMSLDGSRLFWTSAAYDANLVDLGVIGAEIYSCSTNGSVAFSDHQAFETATKQVIYNLPVTSAVSAVDRLDQRFWYFNSTTRRIESLPMSAVRSPLITQQPTANTTVSINGSVYLSVTAIGSQPLSYQWTLAGTNVPGATNYFLSMVGIQPSQDGDYQAVVSNAFGSVTSTVAHVTVLVSPTITSQPQGTNVSAGQTFSLAVGSSGSAPLSYRWTFEGVNISGATNPVLTIINAQAINEGIYRAIVQNTAGSVTSAVALVRVIPSAPTIVNGPVSQTVGASSNASFSVTAVGTQPLSQQWLFNGVAIPGATATQYSFSNVQAGNAGSYRVVVTNGAGSITSAVATLTVTPVIPYFVAQPVGISLPAGTNFTLSALAQGSTPIGYQWQRYGTNLTGAIQTSLALSNASLGDSGAYTMVASNLVGLSTSVVATVIITAAPPVFVEQPVSVSVLAGSATTLNSRATGGALLNYQWYFQGNSLLNQTNRQLVLNPVTFGSAGQYYAVASNVFGVSTSLVATLAVTSAPPIFTQQPASVTVATGTSNTLNSLATGGTPLSYQWYFQNNSLLNQTNRQLVLSPVTLASAGQYYVVASNVFAAVTSVVAQVTVIQTPALQQGLTNQVVDIGSTVVLNVAASGTGPLSYSWQLNGAAIVGTNATLTITNISLSQAGYYRVAVANAYGSISSTGRVSVLGLPGMVLAWGDNSGNQTNIPAGLDDAAAIAGGDYHTLALHRDGTLAAWGYNGDGQTSVPTNALRFVSIAAGGGHNLAVTETGSLMAWGRNDYGQRTIPATATSVLAIAAGESHSLALLSSGTIVGWGDNSFGQVLGAARLTGVRAIAAGRNHSLALFTNGTVAGWGFNAYGQASPPALTSIAAIAAGYLHSAALVSNGTVVVWGDNSYGQLNLPAGLTNVIGISAGDFHTLALRADGTLVAWGDNSYGQTQVPAGTTNVTAVASGYYHGLALVPIAPMMRMSMNGGGIVVSWSGPGILQWAPSANGPFSDVPGAWRSYTNSNMSMPSKFFRLRR
ncbi:MAG: hypothetical protein JWQ71_3847 [Pedosphaera sp.]|nr:hypothetical protein [Pedosphaera sp.]